MGGSRNRAVSVMTVVKSGEVCSRTVSTLMNHPEGNMKSIFMCRDCVHGIPVSNHSEEIMCIVELKYKSGGHEAVCEHAFSRCALLMLLAQHEAVYEHAFPRKNVLPVRLEDESGFMEPDRPIGSLRSWGGRKTGE